MDIPFPSSGKIVSLVIDRDIYLIPKILLESFPVISYIFINTIRFGITRILLYYTKFIRINQRKISKNKNKILLYTFIITTTPALEV